MFSIGAAAVCGAATFAVVFFLVPAVASGVPDFLWMAANVIIACVSAVLIFEKLIPASPIYIPASAVFQFILLLIFADPVSDLLGINLDSGFGGFEFFVGFALPWIIGTTAAQLITLLIFRKLCKGKELNR